jgi:NAD dependent epimerase/dehydratase family enzyme
VSAALEDQRMSGPMISAAPNPVTSRELAKAIGATLHRASFMPIPTIALRILFGEAAAMMLTGQRVRPRRLEQSGFTWRYPRIAVALTNLLSRSER